MINFYHIYKDKNWEETISTKSIITQFKLILVQSYFIKNIFSFKHSIITKGTINFLKAEIGNENILITACYRSPSSNADDFLQILQEYFEENQSKNTNTAFFLEININILENNYNKTEYLNTLNEFGYISMINKPTRQKTCIDHIFLKPKKYESINMTIQIIFKSNITDHDSIILQVVFEDERKNQLLQNIKNS